MSKPHHLGTDNVTYAEDATGYVYLTVPQAPLKPGFMLKVAQSAKAKERVWARLDQQERRAAAEMTETIYARRMGRIAAIRDNLNARKNAADATQAERDFIRASLEALDRKERIMQQSSVYGVAAMQERDAPLPPRRAIVYKARSEGITDLCVGEGDTCALPKKVN